MAPAPIKVVDTAHPAHYAGMKIEPIDAIATWKLNFNLGAVVKHVARAGRKVGNPAISDLLKARYYLNHEIEQLLNEPCTICDKPRGENHVCFGRKTDDRRRRKDRAPKEARRCAGRRR